MSNFYYFLTCTDAKRDIWEYPILTESNIDDKSIERRNAGKRLTTTGGATVCTTCFLIPFLDNFLFLFNKVSQVNVLTQAHDCQINGSVFYSANTVSN